MNDPRQRALGRLLDDPDVRKRYNRLVLEAHSEIDAERREMGRQSRHEAARFWIGRALEALCSGDVVEYVAAVDLACEIAHHREGRA